MKKMIFVSLILFVAHCANAQLAITPEGLMNAQEPESSTITFEYPGVSEEKIRSTYLKYAKQYAEGRRSVSLFENDSHDFMVRFSRVGRFGTSGIKTGSASFSLLFIFEEETVTIIIRDFVLSRIGLHEGDARQYIYTSKGRISRAGKILKPMVEREVNHHYAAIVGTASSMLELSSQSY
jgi:hypothetical protein